MNFRSRLEGLVLTSAGAPAESYRLVVGPGADPLAGECLSHEIRDPSGRFDISCGERGPTPARGAGRRRRCLGRAYSPSARHNDPITIRLHPGSRVSGRIATPNDARSPLRVTLVPHPCEGRENITPEAGRDTATLETPVPPDGSFRFDHVRPDGYRIMIQEGEITWLRRCVSKSRTRTSTWGGSLSPGPAG